jgi:hypothetical protein
VKAEGRGECRIYKTMQEQNMNVRKRYVMLETCLFGLLVFSSAQAQTGTANYSSFSSLSMVNSNTFTANGTLPGGGSFSVTIATISGLHFTGSPGIFDFPTPTFIDGTGWLNAGTSTNASVGVVNDDQSTLKATLSFDFTTSHVPAGYDFFVSGQRDSTVELVFFDTSGNPIDVSGASWHPVLGNYSATFPNDDWPTWTGGSMSGTLIPGTFSLSGNGTIAAWDLPVNVSRIEATYEGSIDPNDLSHDQVLFAFGSPAAGLEPAPFCPKWNQEPDCEYGLNIESWDVFGEDEGPMVADDWISDGRPIHGLTWWGSYIGYESGTPDPDEPPSSIRPSSFRFRWYTDIPATTNSYSRPGDLIKVEYQPLDVFTNTLVAGKVNEEYFCTTGLLPLTGIEEYEHEYKYTVVFTNGFWGEKEDNIYWVSIEALYNTNPTNAFPWGWKTTSLEWNFNDAAVLINPTGEVSEMFFPPPGWDHILNHPFEGESVNMAFHVNTFINPRRCKKWVQPPDLETGENIPSWGYANTNFVVGPLRADDFISDGRPITDIHWWGSYIDWRSTNMGTEANPILPPPGAFRPDAFRLSWHAHDDTNCTPGPLLREVTVPIDKAHETFFASVQQVWKPGGPFEHEYQYYVDLLDTEVSGEPWDEVSGVQYWLDIQAVFGPGFVTGEVHNGWGWKIKENPTEIDLCPAAYSPNGGVSWNTDSLPFPHPACPQGPTNCPPYDLAFELTTTRLPTNTAQLGFSMPEFTDITIGADLTTLVSTGDCGCGVQVLQTSTNLCGGWSDVFTNKAPRQVNTWLTKGFMPSDCFFRIKKTDAFTSAGTP